jgi:hypothetical protein
LLLDAPEHLWRLIERKKYFHAAWLFLLARVVHRALVRNDEQDEETWSSQGLAVLVCILNSIDFVYQTYRWIWQRNNFLLFSGNGMLFHNFARKLFTKQ